MFSCPCRRSWFVAVLCIDCISTDCFIVASESVIVRMTSDILVINVRTLSWDRAFDCESSRIDDLLIVGGIRHIYLRGPNLQCLKIDANIEHQLRLYDCGSELLDLL